MITFLINIKIIVNLFLHYSDFFYVRDFPLNETV